MKRKAYTIEASDLGPRTVRVICSTAALDRAGEVIEQGGIGLASFRSNPIILWSHNPEHPVGTATTIGIAEGQLAAEIEFVPEGVSQKADEICRLVKAGVIKTVSIGFDPIDTVPMTAGKPRGPQRYKEIELLEVSFVSIPANPEAVVVQRSKSGKKTADWSCGASTDLAAGEDGTWDGPAAAERMLDAAADDVGDVDEAKAKRGFLAYDQANPTLRGSYKLPFADLVGDELKAMPAGIRAAASRLSETDIPDDVKTGAERVIKHYEDEMKIGESDKTARPRRTKGMSGRMVTKGLYETTSLAYLLAQLGYITESSRYEEALEGDGSKLPAMLLEIVRQTGAALIAMTNEEVGELIAGLARDGDDETDLEPIETAVVITAKDPTHRKALTTLFHAKRAVVGHVKEGRRISTETAKCLGKALDMHGEAMDLHRKAMRAHTEACDMIKELLPGEGDPNEDGDTRLIQDSGGTDEEQGAKRASLMTKAERLALVRELAAA